MIDALKRNYPSSLSALYAQMEKDPRVRRRKHVRARVRQTLYAHPIVFVEVKPGFWDFTGNYLFDQVDEFHRKRSERLEGRRTKER